MSARSSWLERTRKPFAETVRRWDLSTAAVTVRARPLSPEEAIGNPGRRDYPLLKGRERLIEARIGTARGHAFSDAPREFTGSLRAVLELPLDNTRDRGIYVATLNAVLNHCGEIDRTVHCRDDEPERCAQVIAENLKRRWERVGLIGLNPAIADELIRCFGPDRMRLTDLDPDNVGARRSGVPVWDGRKEYEKLIRSSDGVMVTGTAFVNGTFDAIWHVLRQYNRPFILYGVTASGIAHLFKFEHLCPFAGTSSGRG